MKSAEEITEAAKKYAYDQYYNLESSSEEVISIFIDAAKWAQDYETTNTIGIPITEEHLLKFGFSRELDEPFNWSDKKKYLTDCFLLGHYSDGLHYVKNGVKIGKPLKYIHQLQSLYLVLTEQELEIKSPNVAGNP